MQRDAVKFHPLRTTILAAVAFSAVGFSMAVAAPTGRYTIANGTVYDSKTKLTWQQTVSTTTYSGGGAVTYCAGLGAQLGGSGWRLPTIKELVSIVDYSRSAPAIDPTAFPSTPSGRFWSSTTAVGMTPASAWFLESNGLLGSFPTAGPPTGPTLYARCVR
jgi:hypothetical protein